MGRSAEDRDEDARRRVGDGTPEGARVGSNRIAAELDCSRNPVRRWLQHGDWRPCSSPSRSRKLDGLADWLADWFRRHGGNADVIRQELAGEKDAHVSLRTVERAVPSLRRELVATARSPRKLEAVRVSMRIILQQSVEHNCRKPHRRTGPLDVVRPAAFGRTRG